MYTNVGMIKLSVIEASNAFDEILRFYESCNRKISIDDKDIFVLAKAESEIVGAVRLCFEGATYTLRTMQVANKLQGKGVGRLILQEFKDLIDKMSIDEIYCMPYEHLESFYGRIGFERISLKDVPDFLVDRAESFHQRHMNERVIIMKKKLEL